MRFPAFLYEIPAEWTGRVEYLPSVSALKVVYRARLQAASEGRDFSHISLGNCRVFRHVSGDEYEEEGTGERVRFQYDPIAKAWKLVEGPGPLD